VHPEGKLSPNSSQVLKRSIISKFNRALHADVIVMKPRVSALYCTDLEAPLQANTMQRFVLAGVSTAWAVQATACDAHDRDYQVVIVEDVCAAASEEEHQESMKLPNQIAHVVEVEGLVSL
jgi:biuret amidohydrolase